MHGLHRVLLLGATGTIGRATLAALLARGHHVTCALRPGTAATLPEGVARVTVELTDAAAMARDGFGAVQADTLVSCMASRTGAPGDAWAVDHDAHLTALAAARAAGVTHMVLLSAICVQKPLLEFQRAKLAFEAALMQAGVDWTIVRPTAFFKSLSGQVARVAAGRPFLVFGDGRLTACKPISDRDLGAYLADCVGNPARKGQILPIGGPGPAITPLDQAAMLSDLTGAPLRIRRVPVAMMSAIIGVLGGLGRVAPRLRAKAEFARIGRYYATESMLVWDAESGCYDAEATPEFGTDTLRDHYAAMLRGEASAELGDHAMF
ncbi:MAG: NAD(P)H-binding protein [Rhodobacteraceae bacterium]|nr:NAD(P)H-binding protein [Paracoccaceae bacterium]